MQVTRKGQGTKGTNFPESEIYIKDVNTIRFYYRAIKLWVTGQYFGVAQHYGIILFYNNKNNNK